MILIRYCAIIATLMAATTLVAQEKAGKKRTCRIIYLRAPADAPSKMHLFDGTKSQVVELPRMNLSRPYTLPAGRIKLRMLPKALTKEDKPPKDAPSVMVPANVRDCYLLITTDTKNSVAPVHLQLINANSDRFNVGQILWFNLSPHTVNGTVGDQKLKLPPQSRKIMQSPTSTRERYPVDLSFTVTGDKRLHPLCETSWLHDPRSRMVAFVFMEKRKRTPRVLAFPDFRRPSKKDKP